VFGSQVEFVSVTIDPEHDTPQVLSQYAKEYHADPAGWEFLTGAPSEVDKVLKSYQIVTVPQAGGQIGHPSLTLLIDRNGNIRKQYGTLTDAKEVTTDILRLLKQ
jgi:protein SCO1/2